MENVDRSLRRFFFIAVLFVVGITASLPATARAQVNVTQHHNNPSRDGLFIDPAFTTSAAAAMARDTGFSGTISGAVYAQPLYIENGPGGAAMVIAVTESNNVYALNATTGAVIWQRNVGNPIIAGLPCGNISPVGITGTPIVDLASRALFLDAETEPSSSTYRHMIFSLNVDTGAINSGWPVDVNAKVSGFDSSVQSQRAALAILGNTLYVPYGGRWGDCGSYRGRVVGIPLTNPASVTAWSTTGIGGGIWGVGGIASDGTNLFVATGNTFSTGGTWRGGEAVIRLQNGPSFSGSTTDYWAPTNWLTLDNNDTDIGGSGPILVDVPGATPSALVVALGKDGNAYLINRNTLGGIAAPVAQSGVGSGSIIQAAATYRTSLGTYVAFRRTSGTLTAFKITATNPPAITTGWTVNQSGRGSPFVTSTDGTNNVIVWVVGTEGDERLHGYNGDTGAAIYNGSGANDLMSGTRRFNTAIAARGRIYVANDNKVYAFAVPASATPTPTPAPTSSPIPTASPSPTRTPTPAPTQTPTPPPTATPSPTRTPTPPPTPTPTPSPAPSPTPSPTRTPTATPTAAPTATLTPTPQPTPSPTATPTPNPSPTPGITPSPSPTATPTPTRTPSPTSTPAPTATPTPSPSPTPTQTPTPVPTASPSPSPSSSPSPSPSPTPAPVITVSLPIDNFDTSVPTSTVLFKPVTTTFIDPNLGYVGFQGDFTFDSTVIGFSPPGVQAAGLTGTQWSVSVSIINTGPGTLKTLRVSGFSLDLTPLSGSGTLFNLRMRRLSNSPGATTPLIWATGQNNLILIDEDLNSVAPVQLSGLITITGATPAPTGTPTPTPTPTPPPTPTPSPIPPIVRVSLPTDSFDTSVPSGTVNLKPVAASFIDPSLGFVGFHGDFTFDSAVIGFSPPGVQGTGLTGSQWSVSANIINTGPGTIKTLRVSAFSNDFTALSGSGTLFNLRMLRLSNSPGATSPLVWAASPNNFVFTDQNFIPVSPVTVDGMITITGLTPTPTPTATATPGPSATPTPQPIDISGTVLSCPFTSNPVSGVTFTLTGDTTSSTISDSSGYYWFSALPHGGSYTVTPSKTARPPGSSGIGTTDVVATQRHFLGIIPLSGCRLKAADVNADNVINTVDSIAIQRFYLGWTIGIQNVGKYGFTPASHTYTDVVTNQTAQDYEAVIYGDVAAPYSSRPEGGSQTLSDDGSGNSAREAIASLLLPTASVDTSRIHFITQVTTTPINADAKLVGFQGDLTFDSSVINFQDPPVLPAGLTANNWNVSGNVLPGSGRIRTLRLSAFSLDLVPLSGAGTLFELQMVRVSPVPGTSTLLVWAPEPNNAIFIDSDLRMQAPLSAPSGSIPIIAGQHGPAPSTRSGSTSRH